MAGVWQLIKKNLQAHKILPNTPETQRIDQNLPMGIRLGSMLQISSVDAVLAEGKLRFKIPVGDTAVVSLGEFLLNPFRLHRFYLEDQNGELFTLQIATDKEKNEVVDCKLFALFDDIVTDDWDFWLNEDTGYIGYNIFDTKEGTRYLRVWSNDLEEKIIEQNDQDKITHIPPVKFLETIYSDSAGSKLDIVTYEAMLYGREAVEKVNEYLLVSAAKSQQEASVQILVGIQLTTNEIKLLF